MRPMQPPQPAAYQETASSIAADARAAAAYAIALSDAEDLTDTGPGALERIRAARINAITLAIEANGKEDDAAQADELDEEEYERDRADDRDPYQ
jgi:hypothetical protein